MLRTAVKLGRALRNLPAWPASRRALTRSRAVEAMPDAGVATHLRETAHWLARAQDAARRQGGVAAAWHCRFGWLPPFPETTGYIIPSFFDFAELTGEASYRRRALELASWEVAIQLPDGSVRTGIGLSDSATVFDTGQGLFGFVSAYRESGEERFLAAALRAGTWLLAQQDDDGCWRRGTFRGVPHSYNTRSAWALLLLGEASGEARFRSAARANLAWTCSRQQPNGWFRDAAFHPTEAPLTHTIAYTLQGLLEGGLLLDESRLIEAARRAALVLRERVADDGKLPGTFDADWRGDESFSCLTGNAQLAIIFFVLGNLDGDPTWTSAARRLTAALRRGQDLQARHPGIRGGVAGSRPLDGEYSPWAMLNWAAKFHLDALMLEQSVERGEARRWVLHG